MNISTDYEYRTRYNKVHLRKSIELSKSKKDKKQWSIFSEVSMSTNRSFECFRKSIFTTPSKSYNSDGKSDEED